MDIEKEEYIRLQAERIKRTVESKALTDEMKVMNVKHLIKAICETLE